MLEIQTGKKISSNKHTPPPIQKIIADLKPKSQFLLSSKTVPKRKHLTLLIMAFYQKATSK